MLSPETAARKAKLGRSSDASRCPKITAPQQPVEEPTRSAEAAAIPVTEVQVPDSVQAVETRRPEYRLAKMPLCWKPLRSSQNRRSDRSSQGLSSSVRAARPAREQPPVPMQQKLGRFNRWSMMRRHRRPSRPAS